MCKREPEKAGLAPEERQMTFFRSRRRNGKTKDLAGKLTKDSKDADAGE